MSSDLYNIANSLKKRSPIKSITQKPSPVRKNRTELKESNANVNSQEFYLQNTKESPTKSSVNGLTGKKYQSDLEKDKLDEGDHHVKIKQQFNIVSWNDFDDSHANSNLKVAQNKVKSV